MADDKVYKAEYHGSGTFVISKPKRKKIKARQSELKIKARQSELKNPRRGSRKESSPASGADALVRARPVGRALIRFGYRRASPGPVAGNALLVANRGSSKWGGQSWPQPA